MFRYRTLLIDPERPTERPIQALFALWIPAWDWIKTVLGRASPSARVEVYETFEIHQWTVVKEGDEIKAKPAKIQPETNNPV